jgi:lysophospholipase L1-like esterase
VLTADRLRVASMAESGKFHRLRMGFRTMIKRSWFVALVAVQLLGACTPASEPASNPAQAAHWAAAWTSPPSPFLPGGKSAYLEPYADVTVRQVLQLDAGGNELRVRFTNELGPLALRIGAASLGRVATGGAAREGIVPVTFAGARSVVIPPGAQMLSDPVRMPVARFDDLAIATYFPEATQPTGHRHWVEVSASGDHTSDAAWPDQSRVRGATAVAAVQVRVAGVRNLVVAFGDSITEGAGATAGAHMSWPSQLSRQLAGSPSGDDWIVVNAGISGNRVLHDGGSQNGLARFDRDALSIAGVTDIVLLEGINDLGVAFAPAGQRDLVGAGDLILAYRQMIERAHIRGVRIYGATILPYAGAVYYAPGGDAERIKVNDWIRNGGAFDGVIDLDAVMRDPGDPARLIPKYEIGDHLHPGDAGYAAIAEAVEAFLEESRRAQQGAN